MRRNREEIRAKDDEHPIPPAFLCGIPSVTPALKEDGKVKIESNIPHSNFQFPATLSYRIRSSFDIGYSLVGYS
jgi:hypothetical protein